MKFALLKEFERGAVFKRIKLGCVSLPRPAAKAKKLQFKREWFQPLAWFLDSMDWSSMYFPGDKIADRRKCSVTYIELACLADVRTGGAIGPRRATYAEKAAIIKEGIAKLTRKTWVSHTDGNVTMEAAKFFQHLPSVCSAAPLGFPALPGISRRPIMGKFHGAHAAVGALICYAKSESLVLHYYAEICMAQAKLEKRQPPHDLGAHYGKASRRGSLCRQTGAEFANVQATAGARNHREA